MKDKSRKTAKIVGVLAICALTLLVIINTAFSVSGTYPDTENAELLGRSLGVLSLMPPAFAVVLAFLTGDVVFALVLGCFSGAAMLAAVSGGGVAAAFEGFCSGVLATVSDRENAAVILLCLVIGGMVEVIRKSGGFEALARAMTRRIDTPRKANLVGEALGVIVFFDDYANSLIVGPVLRPVTDKLGISREKLAYLVDSTAAPVTGIAVVSSWVAVEVSVIREGLEAAGSTLSAYSVFLQSIPYCFYCIFCLLFIFQSSLMGREFGPMLKAERRARQGQPLRPGSAAEAEELHTPEDRQWQRIVTAVFPIVLLCCAAFISFYVQGRRAAVAEGLFAADAGFSLETLALSFGSADTIYLVMKASVLGSFAAVVSGCSFRLFTVKEAVQAWLKGASTLLMTAVILALAWTLADAVERLGTAYYVVELISANVAWWIVPALIFAACCVVSYAVGSFGCMFIVMPMALPIAITVINNTGMANQQAFLLACIASVLSGGIFGDHCSPVTDCTILSSIGSGCDNMDHVRTQMPYAITVAAVSVLCGLLPVALGLPVWLALLLGCGALAAVLLLFGRSPDKEQPSENIKKQE